MHAFRIPEESRGTIGCSEVSVVNIINDWLGHLSRNYLLLAVAALLFFAGKGVVGLLTYRHYDRRFQRLECLLREIADKRPET
jgi:hypothetical protein